MGTARGACRTTSAACWSYSRRWIPSLGVETSASVHLWADCDQPSTYYVHDSRYSLWGEVWAFANSNRNIVRGRNGNKHWTMEAHCAVKELCIFRSYRRILGRGRARTRLIRDLQCSERATDPCSKVAPSWGAYGGSSIYD